MKRANGIAARLKALDKLCKSKRPRSALEAAAIQRQRLDLEEGHRRGLVWREDEAQRAVNFFSLLRHWKGKWAGTKFALEDWQEHLIIAPLFGWQRQDRLRRFRTGYIEVPRKNGKTTLAAGIGLQGLVADKEQGAEVYAAATKRDQACILFADAQRCLGPQLRKIVRPFKFSLTCEQTNGYFKPLSSDHDSLDGLNIHRAVIDELHAHKERGLWDVLLGSVGARNQPLIVAITTAGDDEKTICGEVRGMARDVLQGEPEHDDAFFAFIACAESEDDWLDPATWWKANPNLGISLNQEFLEDLARQARVSKASENNFRRKHLDQWITGASEWITRPAWSKCKAERPNLDGRECFAAVDIGWRDDFAALARVFPERVAIETAEEKTEPEKIEAAGQTAAPVKAKSIIRSAWVEVDLWIPDAGRRDVTQSPLVNWIAQKLITATPGNTTDIDSIFRRIQEDRERYDIREIAIDPNNARQFGANLVESGLAVFNFNQTTKNYHEPCMELATLVANGNIQHSGHDILTWMIGNVRLKQNAAGYVMPAKDKSAEKIDGAVAVLMALGCAMFNEPELESVYTRENRGFITLG